MKKLYWLFLVTALLMSADVNAVVMPSDSLQRATSMTTTMNTKQVKVPFFTRIALKIATKKSNQQTEGKKPINVVGVVAFILVATGALLFIVLPFTARLGLVVLLLLGLLFDFISFITNKGKRNPYGGVALGLILLLLLILIIHVGSVGA